MSTLRSRTSGAASRMMCYRSIQELLGLFQQFLGPLLLRKRGVELDEIAIGIAQMGGADAIVRVIGHAYEGQRVEENRQKYGLLKAKMQGVGTRTAKKHLKKVSKKESRFKADENRRISKAVVSQAKGTGRGIALEELTHINARSTVRKAQRDSRSKWAF